MRPGQASSPRRCCFPFTLGCSTRDDGSSPGRRLQCRDAGTSSIKRWQLPRQPAPVSTCSSWSVIRIRCALAAGTAPLAALRLGPEPHDRSQRAPPGINPGPGVAPSAGFGYRSSAELRTCAASANPLLASANSCHASSASSTRSSLTGGSITSSTSQGFM
jgi:hypothetical protein